MIETQTEPCHNCKTVSGWWQAVSDKSMTVFGPDGDVKEHRIYQRKKKYCWECNSDITKIVK